MVYICGWVTSHTSMSHVVYMNESSQLHQCVISHVWMSRFTYFIESYHTLHEWVMNEVSHAHQWFMTYIYQWFMSYIMTYIYQWFMSYIMTYIYQWFMSYIMTYIYQWFMSYITLSHAHQWFMSYIWMSHITYINESCHLWMSHLTSMTDSSHIKMNESCQLHWRVMSYLWMCHVTYINASCIKYELVNLHTWTREWVMSRTSMRHVMWVNESSHIHQRVMS